MGNTVDRFVEIYASHPVPEPPPRNPEPSEPPQKAVDKRDPQRDAEELRRLEKCSKLPWKFREEMYPDCQK